MLPLANKRVEVRREKTVSNGAGGQTSTWRAHLTDVRCAILERSDTVMVQGLGLTVISKMVMYLEGGVDVIYGDRIVDGSLTWRVKAIKDLGGRGIAQEAELEPVRTGATA